MNLTRRQLVRQALLLGSLSKCIFADAAPNLLHCTPAPSFPIPLNEGTWRSPEFPVGKHSYHIWLNVDRSFPLKQLDCDLGPPRPGNRCESAPLLDLDWKLWDGTVPVKSWTAQPIKAAGWGEAETSCFLGAFEGKRNGTFAVEFTIKKDAGRLKELHPRIQIVKNPGYWCWL
jgi:hypothetical protein